MKKFFIAAAAASMLAACGGGEDSSTATATSAAGYWSSNNTALLVTGGGELWAVELTSPYYTLYAGNVTTSGDKFSANIKAFSGGVSATGTASGSFVEKKTLTGTATSGTLSSNFSMSYDSTYEAAPALSRIAGTYSVNSGGSLVVSAAGAISGTSGGCAITGTVTPGTDGGNYYRLSVKFGAAPCAIPNGTATGVVGQSGTRLIGGVVSGNLGDAFILTKI